MAVALALPLAGCSFLFMRPARTISVPNQSCTQSVAAPVVDGVVTLLRLAGVAYALSLPDSAYAGLPISKEADVAIGLSVATLYGASGIYGVVNASECRALHAHDDANPFDRARDQRLFLHEDDLKPAPMPPPAARPSGPDGGAPEVAPSGPAVLQRADDE
jgi:hypothetical protein